MKRNIVIIILVFFGLIYCSISLYNHYNFRSYCFDLGLVNNAIYDYAHLRWNDCMLIQPQFKNMLEDHMTLFQVIFSPLYYLFGTYSMLIAQILCTLVGAYGIFKLFREENTKLFAILAMVHFLTAFGIFSAMAFDYHDNVVGSMAVPWLFYFFRKQNWKGAIIAFICILISKENMALWMVFIALGLVLDSIRNKRKMIIAAGFAVISLLYFYVMIDIVMPSLAVERRGYLHFQYGVLGDGFSEAFRFMISNPGRTLELLFVNHLSDPSYWNVKLELHWMVLVSGGYCFLLRPQYLLMMLPVYGQKMFSDHVLKWGINYHYSVEFAPILTILLFTVLATIKQEQWKKWLAIIACAVSVYFSIHKIDARTSPWYDGAWLRFYSMQHYKNDLLNVPLAHKVLESLIPPNAVVSAQSQVIPHLAFRDTIYQFPVEKKAEYIILLDKHNPYPMTKEELKVHLETLRSHPEWKVLYDFNNMLIVQRKKIAPLPTQ